MASSKRITKKKKVIHVTGKQRFPRPAEGTIGRQVWDICDALRKRKGYADKWDVFEACDKLGINRMTIRCQFSWWRQHHAIKRRSPWTLKKFQPKAPRGKIAPKKAAVKKVATKKAVKKSKPTVKKSSMKKTVRPSSTPLKTVDAGKASASSVAVGVKAIAPKKTTKTIAPPKPITKSTKKPSASKPIKKSVVAVKMKPESATPPTPVVPEGPLNKAPWEI